MGHNGDEPAKDDWRDVKFDERSVRILHAGLLEIEGLVHWCTTELARQRTEGQKLEAIIEILAARIRRMDREHVVERPHLEAVRSEAESLQAELAKSAAARLRSMDVAEIERMRIDVRSRLDRRRLWVRSIAQIAVIVATALASYYAGSR